MVGDRYLLTNRQREALRRAACSDQALFRRPTNALPLTDLRGENVAIDGYNLLITIESSLSNGFVIACRDGTYRDIASIHGTYRRVEETFPAIEAISAALKELGVAATSWYLDKPVSNSGRLKGYLLEAAQEMGSDWEVELVFSPDKVLAQTSSAVVVSSDGAVLDQAERWANVTRYMIDRLPDPQILPMQGNRFAAGCGL